MVLEKNDEWWKLDLNPEEYGASWKFWRVLQGKMSERLYKFLTTQFGKTKPRDILVQKPTGFSFPKLRD